MTQSTKRNEEPPTRTAIESDAPVAERVENGDMTTDTPSPASTKTHRSRRWWWINRWNQRLC